MSVCCGRLADVAVKMLRYHDPSALATAASNLRSEAAALQQLQHPHVVRVFGVCLAPHVAVIMEFVSLGSLARWIELHRNR